MKFKVAIICLSVSTYILGFEIPNAQKRLPDRLFLEKIKLLIKDSARNSSRLTKHTIFALNLDDSNRRQEDGLSETHHLMLVVETANASNQEPTSNKTVKRIELVPSGKIERRQGEDTATTQALARTEPTPTIEHHNDKDYISEGADTKIESHIKYLPNSIYYNTEKKCVNWLYGCDAKVKSNIMKALIRDGLSFDYFHLTGKDIHSYLRDVKKEEFMDFPERKDI